MPTIPPISNIGVIIFKCSAANVTSSGEPLEMINFIIGSAKKNMKTHSAKKKIIVDFINVEYNLLTSSDGFSFKLGINFEKIATVALWNGPPTPPNKIKDKDGIWYA